MTASRAWHPHLVQQVHFVTTVSKQMLQSAEKIRYPNGIVPQDQLSRDQFSQPQLFTRSTPV